VVDGEDARRLQEAQDAHEGEARDGEVGGPRRPSASSRTPDGRFTRRARYAVARAREEEEGYTHARYPRVSSVKDPTPWKAMKSVVPRPAYFLCATSTTRFSNTYVLNMK